MLTFRLAHLKTLRGATRLQDLLYTYDPAGNITSIRDDSQQTIYFNGQVVEPHCGYVYDAIYRLIEAKGREHIGQHGRPETTWNNEFRVNLQHPHNGQAMRHYVEHYVYDAVGNFDRLIHQAANGNWTRSYTCTETSLLQPAKKNNRLSSTIVHPNGNQTILDPYTHDVHGNMTSMPHLSKMEWDFKDQLQATSKQVVNNGGTPETTYYVYDAAGQRVRKVTELATGQVKDERVYLGGFEIYRRHGVNPLVRETLHIMDDKQRVALVETRTQGNEPGAPAQLIRYQFGNHLGSASLELDDQAQVISYEESYPYGSTSYQAERNAVEVSLKRYRYTGMERDEESGLNYHGARYYAPWLGRWASADPAGLVDGTNLFRYASDDPVDLTDPEGTQPRPPPPPPPPPPVPAPRQTPFNLVSDSPALTNWQRATNEVLETRFRGGSLSENLRRFEQHVCGLPQGSGRRSGTNRNYARRIYNEVRTRFYRLEAATPSFAYSQAELSLLRQGRAPGAGFQLHHMEHIAQNPAQAVRAGNIVFTQAGPTGGLAQGTGHYDLHNSQGAKQLEAFQQRQPVGSTPRPTQTPPSSTPPTPPPEAPVSPPPDKAVGSPGKPNLPDSSGGGKVVKTGGNVVVKTVVRGAAVVDIATSSNHGDTAIPIILYFINPKVALAVGVVMLIGSLIDTNKKTIPSEFKQYTTQAEFEQLHRPPGQK